MRLEHKTVFITGATSGFGRALALQCAQEGARLVISGRRAERLQSLADELGDKAHALPLDIRDNDAVKTAIRTLPRAFAEIDILVNNAGLALGLASFEGQDMAYLDQMVDTNIKGMIYCTHAILPGMIERQNRNRGGHIINIGSTAGIYPYPGGNVYGGTKAFVAQFSLNLRADLTGKNIRVTVIEPGMAETEFSLVRFQGDQAKADKVYEGVEALTANDVANTIVWCASLPGHVNVNRLELMPTQQSFAGFAVHRDKA